MEQKSTTKISLINVLKLFLLIAFGSMLIVGASIMLRRLCANIYTPASAEEEIYVQLTLDTPLYSTNRLTDEILTLPKGYYARVLSSSDTLSRVEYNGIIGYINNQNAQTATEKPTGTLFKSANLYTRSDAGTYLRADATTSSDRIWLIPAGSTLTYLGEKRGTIPDDGTSDMWYYILFDYGDTTTYIGYVYSERTIITNLSVAPVIEALPTSIASPTDSKIEPEDSLTSTPLSSGVKIFLIILFSTLAIIIFALLLISPKQKKQKQSTEKISSPEIPAYNQPEFASFVDFTQPKKENTPYSSFAKPKTSNSHNKVKVTTPDIHSASLPPSLARYFKSEPATPFDDEEL